jgi:hypothetical protein
MTDGKVFLLDGWGGYYMVYFDHSVENKADTDTEIPLNHHIAGMNESGIVWTRQDINGDGMPNEIWYRFKGSRSTAKPFYAMTHFKPSSKALIF